MGYTNVTPVLGLFFLVSSTGHPVTPNHQPSTTNKPHTPVDRAAGLDVGDRLGPMRGFRGAKAKLVPRPGGWRRLFAGVLCSFALRPWPLRALRSGRLSD